MKGFKILYHRFVAACNPGSYGKDCKEVCGHCEGNEPCNHINGSCPGSCEPGYAGEMCLTKCGSGRYGRNCSSACGHCANNATCDPITGACPECAPGWTDSGDNKCDRACNDGWFGKKCKQRCGYCRDDEPCHHVTGSCLGFCEPGYLGDKCDESEFSQLLAIQRKMLNSVRELLSFKRRKVGLIANITSPTDLK
ncbi:scavenger receptor class F member 1-like [Saccostrea cucullata]|uniref:scavenger receptor class F member 1-like n=1 Tax=Saccostrea cuccullata TaxID=36930 RepID=UPI002ED54741